MKAEARKMEHLAANAPYTVKKKGNTGIHHPKTMLQLSGALS